MATDLVKRDIGGVALYQPWTPESLQEAIDTEKKLREVILTYYRSAMVDKHHYYRLDDDPKKKPALSKEGALNLCSLFKVRAEPEKPDEIHHPDGHYTVRFRVNLISLATGDIMASGDGMCSTRESKYAYRWVFSSEVPADVDKTKLVKKEGTSKRGNAYVQYKLPNPDIADQYNTVLKMSDKRATVNAVLKLPLASELFTQDLEEDIQARVEEKRHAREDHNASSGADEKEMRATLMNGILETLRTIPQREKRRELSQAAFGCDWAGMKSLTLPQLQAGYAHLQELLSPDTGEADEDDDVPDFSSPDAAIEGNVSPDATTAEGMATPAQVDELKVLAQSIGEDAVADMQDFADHWPNGLPLSLYTEVKARLETRKAARA